MGPKTTVVKNGQNENAVVKPKVLYHASPIRDLRLLEPRAESIRDEEEGPVVFASSDKAEATKFIVPSDDSWTRKMRFGDVQINIISDRQRYEKTDKGGAIYILNPNTFEHDETRGTSTEWISKVAVEPISKKDYASGLQAQLENGVQVYFVDKHTFDRIAKAEDRGNSIIRGLKSENEIRGINQK